MRLLIHPDGSISCAYGEELNLAELGDLTIRRASYVEPTPDGQWMADLSPVNGPQLGPFETRSAALAAEVQWLERHWLTRP